MKQRIELTKENVERYRILTGEEEDGWTHKAVYRANRNDVQGILVQSFSSDNSAGGIAEISIETLLQNYQDINWYIES